MQSSSRVNKIHDSHKRSEYYYEEVEKKFDRLNHRKAIEMKREQQKVLWEEEDNDDFMEDDYFSR